MNGRLFRAFFSFRPFGPPPTPLDPGVDWDRLGAAVLLSCVLHAALVFMPPFGASRIDFRPSAARGGERPGPGRALEVRVEPAGSAAASSERSATASGSPAGPTAEDKPPASRGIDVLRFSTAEFHLADELTSRPRPTTPPRLDVPEIAPLFTSGRVILRVWIDALGNVVFVDVEKSEVPRPIAASAASAFRRLRYVPGEIDGRRVAALMRIEVTYIDGKNVAHRELARP